MYRIGQEEIDAVARVIRAKELFKTNEGPYKETENFEKEMREKLEVKHAVAMTSGMAALTSALIGMGIGPGDEVIVPAYTYIATAFAVLSVGAMPVVAEIDEALLLDADDVEKKISPRTKAIIPVHMVGYPCNMEKIMAVAKKHNLKVLEDSCQAVGGSFKGKRLGTIGDAGAYSFNFWKNISAGEGGALLTDDKEIFEKGLIYHDSCAIAYFGDQMQDFSTETFCGTEFRTNEITSAIMRVQLTRLDGILKDLRKNKKLLMDELRGHFNFLESHDPEGECSSVITLKFDTPEEAKAVAEKVEFLSIPAYVNKHACWYWDIMFSKRGAAHPLMNPFNMEANKNAPEFTKDMCQKSFNLLACHAHYNINPDWTPEEIKEVAKKFIEAKN